jgi:hypothetical protein
MIFWTWTTIRMQRQHHRNEPPTVSRTPQADGEVGKDPTSTMDGKQARCPTKRLVVGKRLLSGEMTGPQMVSTSQEQVPESRISSLVFGSRYGEFGVVYCDRGQYYLGKLARIDLCTP